MRLIILALLLALAFGTAQAYPLQGSDGTATVTIFGSIRTPLNETLEILKVDVGLMGTENATYKLVDANDSVYEPGLYKTLSSGRQLLYFLIPKDDLFKLITVTPLSRKSININWWARPKVGNENLIIRYYGITDWLTNPDEQGIVVQVTAQSNVTQSQFVSPENFTLPLGLQWFRGEYYTLYSVVLAGSLFNTIPILILFFLFQRYFIKSIATTGSKEG